MFSLTVSDESSRFGEIDIFTADHTAVLVGNIR